MRSIALMSGSGRRNVARGKCLTQRQQVEQQFDQRAGIAARVPAIGKNLPFEVGNQMTGRARQMTHLPGDAECRIGQRGMRLQSRHAIWRVLGGAAQKLHLLVQAAQKAPIKLRIRFIENERRLRQPRHDPPRQDFRLPGLRIPRTLQADPFIDQGAGVGARDSGVGSAQVAQPAEAEQGFGPFLRRLHHLERRAPVADHDLAGKGEAAAIDFRRARRIGRAKVLRSNHKPVAAPRQCRQGRHPGLDPA